MRRAVLPGILVLFCLASASVVRGDHQKSLPLREQIEATTALLDSHTRRLYYEIRSEAEGDDDQAQLLSDARELWRAARRTNDRAMDGVSASKLDREIRHLEDAFHAVEQQFSDLRRDRVAVAPLSKRLRRIDDLVHAAHDRVHDLMDQEKAVSGNPGSPQPPVRTPNYGYRSGDPLPRVQQPVPRATEYVDPPAIRVGPDGLYFDGRRFTIPLGR